ncbi:MAG TPA: hypothetical protein VH436_08125 [Vicinamibacterales bacterium]
MIHEDLIRHFHSQPEPRLSAAFSARLRQNLDGIPAPSRRTVLLDAALRWTSRLYWIAAVVLVIVTVRRVPVSSQQLVTLAAIGVPILLVLQRALGASSLRRVLREALRGE